MKTKSLLIFHVQVGNPDVEKSAASLQRQITKLRGEGLPMAEIIAQLSHRAGPRVTGAWVVRRCDAVSVSKTK